MSKLERESALTAERLRELLDYNPETGALTNKVTRSYRAEAGDESGWIDHMGYRRMKIFGRTYAAHRLAWLHVYGKYPDDQLDHINGNRSDNRLANLRPCTQGQNNQNLGRTKANKSGVMGVSWKARNRKWCAQIKYQGVVHHLGLFQSIEKARGARLAAKQAMHTFNPMDPSCMGVPV